MPDTFTIPKSTSSFPAYLDWSLLRQAGIEHIEQLGSDLWTDYNLHDPGITILEVLCYALTDLGYRTNFDIKDLLARSHAAKNSEAKTIFRQPYDDNFFTAAEILSCNPVTINDFRKLLMDIPGVKNAWLEPAADGEIPIYLHRKKKRLQFDLPENGQEKLDRVCLRGLYDICLELEPLLVRDACGSLFFSKEGLLKTAHEILNAHRNLCEDVCEVTVFGEEQIAVCADIELTSSANPQDVLLEIYKQVEEFLSPTLHFYTLQEMLRKGKRVEDIFEGRPLTARSHGFIDTDDLKKLEPKQHLHASDLYRVIMDVNGVLAIRNLSLANSINDVALTKGEKWCLELTPKYRPHFDLGRSQITFFKGVLPFTTGKPAVEQRYLEEKAAKAKALLDHYQLDLPIPEGQHRDLDDYLSIMEDFPLTYGVGEAGIKNKPDARRKGQAKQLKGYLLFFDQLLANYLSQLAHVRDLFSMRPDEERNGKAHTYFTHLLPGVPGIELLVKNLQECSGNDSDQLAPEDYPSYLQYISESIETYQERRNRFLDHLLARFSESFTDYVMLMFEVNGKQQDGARVIRDKAGFLSSYPDISRNRGKGFDYTQSTGCKYAPGCGEQDVLTEEKNNRPGNVSGLEKRVAKLLGMEGSGWQYLAHVDSRKTVAGYGFSIKKSGASVLGSKMVWATEEEACQTLADWHPFLCDEKFYRRLTYDVAGEKEFAVTILDKDGNPLAIGQQRFPSLARYCKAVDEYFFTLEKTTEDKIELEETDEVVFYVVKAEDGEELLRLQAVNEDLVLFKELVKTKKYYCRKDFTVPFNNEYGFILVNDAEECIAESTQRYVDPEKREEVIHWLISQIKMPGLDCAAVRETECYSFQLFDYTCEKLLLESTSGFQSPQDAMAFFDSPDTSEDLMGWAVAKDNYEKTEQDGFHSFFLKKTGGETVARHPHQYATVQECDDRLQAIIYYLDDVPPVTGVDGTPGTFEFEITDAADNVLFKSIHTYPTQAEAKTASWLVRMLARHRVYYHLLEDPEIPLPYGFELLDRSGNPIAAHSHWYGTDCERDLAVDVIIFCSENVDVQRRIIKKEDSYYYDLLDPEGGVLVMGLVAHRDTDAAEMAWEEFMVRARVKENFQLTQIEGSSYPFGFELLNVEGKSIAASALTYATEAESKMALRAVLNYVCHTEWLVEMTGDPGSYHFWLEGPDGKRLLDSIAVYPDGPSARIALQNVLQHAQDPANFYHLDHFGFELRNAEGNALASHPHEYASEPERDAAIDLVVSYVRTDAPRIAVPNIGGAFQAVIFGENGGVVFKGTTLHPAQDLALGELEHLLLLAANPAYYHPYNEGHASCSFGFRLLDYEGATAAEHPLHYPSATERDAAMMSIFAWLTHGDKLKDEVIVGKPKFRFDLKDNGGNVLLAGFGIYDTEDLAAGAFTELLVQAGNMDFFEKFEEQNKFGFRLKNKKGEPIAGHGILYETEAERDEAIQDLLLFVKLRGTINRLSKDDETGKWSFAMGGTSGSEFFFGGLFYEDKNTAADALFATFQHAQCNSRYRLTQDDKTCTFSFELTDEAGNPIAVYVGTPFNSAADRDAAICNYSDLLKQQTLSASVSEAASQHCFILKDLSGKVLLQGKHEYETVEKAKEIWGLVTEAACHAANFVITYDNPNCRYSVELLVGGSALAVPPGYFFSRTAAHEWIALITLILKKQPVQGGAAGTDCGFYFQIQAKCENGDETKTAILKGVQRYPAPSGALRACHGTAPLLKEDDYFKVLGSDSSWSLSVINEDGEQVARSEMDYEDETSATDDLNCIKASLGGVSAISCENTTQVSTTFRKSTSHCQIKNGDTVLLESLQGETDGDDCSHCNLIHELAQREERYSLITNEEECLYGFELTDNDGIPIAAHPLFYTTARERGGAIRQAAELVNGEGLHLVEHILLRPARKGTVQAYSFELFDSQHKIPLLQSVAHFTTEEEAWAAFLQMWASLWHHGKNKPGYVLKMDDPEALCQFSFKIMSGPEGEEEDGGPPRILATPAGPSFLPENRDKLLEGLVQIVKGLEEAPVEMPELPDSYQAFVTPLRLMDEVTGDKLMNPVLEHLETDSMITPAQSDPYSFRATVVVPYWPIRFQQPEFRAFVETTLRREAPAHIFLRICWVDACQMKDFEEAYCRWIATQQAGEDSCGATAARNKLLKVLCRLRSIYPAASLHDCHQPSEGDNRIVLNYSIIGSVNSSSHGK